MIEQNALLRYLAFSILKRVIYTRFSVSLYVPVHVYTASPCTSVEYLWLRKWHFHLFSIEQPHNYKVVVPSSSTGIIGGGQAQARGIRSQNWWQVTPTGIVTSDIAVENMTSAGDSIGSLENRPNRCLQGHDHINSGILKKCVTCDEGIFP